MIVETFQKGNVHILHVARILTKAQSQKLMGTAIKRSQIPLMIDFNADVYDADTGDLLLRFRKKQLSHEALNSFFDATIDLARTRISNYRVSTAGTSKPASRSNIFGFYDKFSASQYIAFARNGFHPKYQVRETAFNMESPSKYRATLPLLKEIDLLYKKLVPPKYALQKKESLKTPFHIRGTSFTTVTINLNFQTRVHIDKGDYVPGFGNLAVIENGSYSGAETCFPAYGLGVNVRMGDILFMNVHEPHANLPMKLANAEAERLSIVCYLRTNIVRNSEFMSPKEAAAHLKKIKQILHKDS
jgi:hypothetical protein